MAASPAQISSGHCHCTPVSHCGGLSGGLRWVAVGLRWVCGGFAVGKRWVAVGCGGLRCGGLRCPIDQFSQKITINYRHDS